MSKAETDVPSKSYVDLSTNISMEDLLNTETKSDFAPETIVHGIIMEKRQDGVLVDIGYKAEGFVPSTEFPNWEEVKKGDEIDVFLEEIENEQNMPGISLQRANAIKSWQRITSEYGEGSTIKGIMKHRVKGGIIIDLNGVEAFLPGSQIDIGPVKNMDDFLGKEYEFKILKINQERRNIVVSRRELLEESRKDRRAALLEEMQVGQIRKGVVKNITDFGAFVDLGGVDGLLHITDMSWGRIAHPNEMLEIGQEIEVLILDIDYEKERVSLGLKQKTRNPWDDVENKYQVGSPVKGRVVNIMHYGAFVGIENDIDGMTHFSDMSWTRKINNPNEVLKVGDEVEAVILDIDPAQQRISLGLKQTEVDPWANIEEIYKIGDVVKGKVTKITAFGAFIELSHKIDGLVHISQISNDRVEKVKDKLAMNQEIEARVIKIDKEERRIGLSIKALDSDFNEADLKAAGEEVSAALKPGEALGDMSQLIGDSLDELDVVKNS